MFSLVLALAALILDLTRREVSIYRHGGLKVDIGLGQTGLAGGGLGVGGSTVTSRFNPHTTCSLFGFV